MEESLLCNEVWLMSPGVDDHDHDHEVTANSFDEEAFAAFLAKETRYSPRSGYLDLLRTHNSIADARLKAVTWIIKSQTRMDLCAETIFAAVNCLDRFISITQCHCQGWKSWMFELLSISCLSIAAKFNETSAYSLHEFQEDLECWFALNLIRRMEVTVLKALDWRVDCTTPFSYISLLTKLTASASASLLQQLTKTTIQLLLHILLDPEFLEFKQCVVAISTVKTALQDLVGSREYFSSFKNLETLIPQHHKDDLIHCQRLVRKVLAQDETTYFCSSSPSSPVTVLKVQYYLFNSFEFGIGDAAAAAPPLSLKIDFRSSKKRKRER